MGRIRRALLTVLGPLFGFGEAGALIVTPYSGHWLRVEIEGRFVMLNGAKTRAFSDELSRVIAQWDEANAQQATA